MHNVIPLFFLAFSLIFAGCSERNPGSDTKSAGKSSDGGKLMVEPKIHRLGRISGGIDKSIQVETILTNAGKSRLQVHDVVASCDCTKASLSQNDLEPGESAILITHIKLVS